MSLRLVLLLIASVSVCHGARVLGVFPVPGISHYILGRELMKGLADAGHDVTMISPFEEKEVPRNGSYKSVVLTGFYEDFQSKRLLLPEVA